MNKKKEFSYHFLCQVIQDRKDIKDIHSKAIREDHHHKDTKEGHHHRDIHSKVIKVDHHHHRDIQDKDIHSKVTKEDRLVKDVTEDHQDIVVDMDMDGVMGMVTDMDMEGEDLVLALAQVQTHKKGFI